MPHNRKKYFYRKPSNKLVVGSTLVIVQRESEKQDENQNSVKVFYNVSLFELKILQRVRF